MCDSSNHQNRPHDRGGGSSGWLLSLITAVALVLTAATGFAQMIATDKLDYQPGQTVTITGQGWQPQERVTLTIGNTLGTRPTVKIDVTATATGTFANKSFVTQEIDRGQMLVLNARGASGAEAMVAFRDAAAPGSLRCSGLTTSDPTHYSMSPSQKATCTIEGASDLSAAQQAGTAPVEVMVRNDKLGNQRATVTSVSGKTITFVYTAPASVAGTSVVSYGPIKACDPASGKCATFPTIGNDANGAIVSGNATAAAGFAYAVIGPRWFPPNLSVVKTPSNGAFTQGAQVTFQIVVSNTTTPGSQSATNVKLTDVLPGNGGLVWQTATTTQGSCVNPIVGNSLSCDLGTIPPQGSVTVTVKSTLPTPALACQAQPNPNAIATADGGLIAYGSGSLTCTPPPQLKVYKWPKTGTFAQGTPFTYSIVVSNPADPGSGIARNVQLRDQLPGNGGLTWATVTTTAGTCSLSNNFLSCSLGDIAPRATVTVVPRTTSPTPPEACQDQPNPAAIATADGGLMAQDTGLATCTPPTPGSLTIAKTPKGGTFPAGGQASFTIVVSNPAPVGSGSLSNVTLTDVLPTNGGMTWTSAVPSQGACSIANNTLNCGLGTIAAQGAIRVVVSSPMTTPIEACQSQPNPAAIATGSTSVGTLSVQDYGSLNCTPAITANCVTINAVQGVPITPVTLVATGGVAPYTFTAVGLPGGLTISTSGTISGTPTASGTFNYTVTIRDSLGRTGTINCSLTVAPVVGATCVAITAVQGVPITAVQLVGTGGAGGPYTFTATGLPTGLTISTGGLISGTPTVSGTFSYTVTVRDKAGNTGTVNCSVTVAPRPGATCVAITAVQGVPITPVQLIGTGGLGAPYTFTATGLPTGLTMSTGGLISGTPTVSGTFSYTVTVRDRAGNTGTANCSVTVAPPVGATCVAITAVQGMPITPVQLVGTGGLGGPYTFSATGLPTGLTISTGGLISGTPTVSGTFSYTVTVRDRAGNTGTANCSVTVTPVCIIPGVTISGTSWNKFNIPAGTSPVVWVHAHIGTPSGIPTNTRTTVLFRNVSLNLNGTVYPLPDGLMIFDPAAPSTITTTYNPALNRWETLVNPRNMSNEMFFTGAAIPVTPAIAAGAKATFSYTTVSEARTLSFPWQWSAAVYTFWPGNNAAMILPFHSSLHAGTPLNTAVQKSLIQGPRGGGGSNFTGSWSATGKGVCP